MTRLRRLDLRAMPPRKSRASRRPGQHLLRDPDQIPSSSLLPVRRRPEFREVQRIVSPCRCGSTSMAAYRVGSSGTRRCVGPLRRQEGAGVRRGDRAPPAPSTNAAGVFGWSKVPAPILSGRPWSGASAGPTSSSQTTTSSLPTRARRATAKRRHDRPWRRSRRRGCGKQTAPLRGPFQR